MGGLAALEQIRLDAEVLDRQAMAVGPFARIDAGAVTAQDNKTRGVISNLFGSQAAYQVAVMDLTLDADAWVDTAGHPAPRNFADADAWAEAFFLWQSERGPRHGAAPRMTYAALWTLWLGMLPYGLWSRRVAAPSMVEFRRWVAEFETILGGAVAHFGLSLRPGVSVADLAAACASLTEGAWLNQCLTDRHPTRPDEPAAAALVRAGLLLWRGAVSG